MSIDRHLSDCEPCSLRWAETVDRVENRTCTGGWDADAHAEFAYASMLGPSGTLWLANGPLGLVYMSSEDDEWRFTDSVERLVGQAPVHAPRRLEAEIQQLREYFTGRRRDFSLAIDYRGTTVFQRDVLQAVRQVAYGDLWTYRDIACAIGRPNAMRAVGTVLARSPWTVVIPCHRIVRSDGTTGRYGLSMPATCGSAYRQMLLTMESAANTAVVPSRGII